MPGLTVKKLNQVHPDHPGASLVRRYRALYEGGEAWRAFIDHWVPRNPQEPEKLWKERKERATYANHAGGIVELLAAYLFVEPSARKGLDGKYWPRFLANADRQRTSWDAFFKQRLIDAEVGRDAYIWVNLPARPTDPEGAPIDDGTLGQELMRGQLDAYLVGINPEQVLDWGENDEGNLTWILFWGLVSERNGPADERKTHWQWTYIDERKITRWRWTSKEGEAPGDEEEATEVLDIEHNMGTFPVVRLRLPPGLWTMSKLSDPATSELRGRNDLDWGLYRAAHALMWIKRNWGGENPVLGSGYFLELELEDDIGYAEPSGVAFEVLSADCKERLLQLYRVVQQMAMTVQKDGAQVSDRSGVSKQEDWRAAEIVLGAYADLVLDAMRATAEIIRGVRKEKSEWDIGGLEGWQRMDLSVFLEAAMLATDARAASPTFRRVVARIEAERVLGDSASEEEMAEVRSEIEGWDPDALPALPALPPTDPPKE